MFSKPPTINSKRIRESAKGETCTLRLNGCKHDIGVVFCHINSRWKGMGNKSPDLFGCYGCYYCHGLLDAGMVSKADQLRAMQETQMILVEKTLIQIN